MRCNKLSRTLKEVLRKHDLRQYLVEVFPVGTGTGNKDMFTLKAHQLIQSADIVFYDNLINQSVIDEIKNQKVFVGK